MQIAPYLSFDGQCAEAFRFYEKILGGKNLFIMRMGDSPVAKDVPNDSHDRIMHASLEIGNTRLMGADGPSGRDVAPRGFCVSLHVEGTAEAERLFAALGDGGNVDMPMQETFWARRFGMCTDRFGIPWMINCEKPV